MAKKRILAYGSAGIALTIFLAAVSVSPATSLVVTPPSDDQGVSIAGRTDKASFVKGEVVPIDLSLSNTGGKPFQTANLMIGFDVLKDDQIVYGYRMLRDYPAQAPFTLQLRAYPSNILLYTMMQHASCTSPR